MPLVAYKDLPAFKRLKDEGRTILLPERALQQDIRELHFGLLNMMPDAALKATERQFFRLVGESNQIVQLYIHPFTLPEIPRSQSTQNYIKEYYEPFDSLQKQGLDALIITGANITQPNLEDEPFWKPLEKIVDWAWNNVASTMCSCLATHAVMQFRYGQKRTPFPDERKLWGVYGHRVVERTHPLVRNMNTIFDVPHSRFNRVTEKQFEQAGMKVLVQSDEAGTHIAVSDDGFRLVCMQGHPEYDMVSLFKEYKREVNLYKAGFYKEKPPFPVHYFSPDIAEILENSDLNEIEEQILPGLENTWTDSARSILASWTGLVYQITNLDRSKQFMDGIDPENPLGI